MISKIGKAVRGLGKILAPGIRAISGFVSDAESMWSNPGRDGKRKRLSYGGFKYDKGNGAAARRKARRWFKPTTLAVTPRREGDFTAPYWGRK